MTGSRLLQAALLALLLATPGCTRLSSSPKNDQSVIQDGSSSADRGSSPVDGQPDSKTSDSSPGDTVPGEAVLAADSTSPPKSLTCAPPTLAIANDDKVTYEPAVRADGLVLTARANTVRYWASRPSLSEPFGPWSEDGPFDVSYGDPSFFVLNSQEMVMVTHGQREDGSRIINICSLDPTFSCEEVTLFDKLTGSQILTDTDGPSVQLVEGQLLMVHNVSPTENKGIANIYQAMPIADNLTQWETEPVEPLCSPSMQEDDPALSPDGTMILYGRGAEGVQGDLYIAYRNDTSPVFSTPTPLTGANSPQEDSAPYLIALPTPGQYELFFYSNRDGNSRTYHALCSR